MTVINLDSDGVVFPFHVEIEPFVREAGHEPDMTMWSLGLERKEFNSIFEHAVIEEGLFLHGDPIPGAVTGIWQLQASGYRVRIVTSKIIEGNAPASMWAMRDTVEWYRKQGLTDLEFVFTGHKYGKTNYPADIVIDDHPSLEWVQRGALNILYSQPWNEHVDVTGLARRAYGWRDVLGLVMRKAA